MTCIVGMIRNNKVFMGCDSGASTSSEINSIKNISEKIFIHKVNKRFKFMYGFTSSFRMGQVLKYDFYEPELPKEFETTNLKDLGKIEFKTKKENDKFLDKYLISSYIKSLREFFKNAGFSNISSNEETGGFFLLGITDSWNLTSPRLLTVSSDFAIIEHISCFDSVGSGQYFAKGALKVLEKIKTCHAIKF